MKEHAVKGAKLNSWLLWGARVALGPRTTERMDVEVRCGRIVSMRLPTGRVTPDRGCLDMRGFLIMPGLINAHDHLEFNLFPRLGKGPYPNAGEWARDIYRPEATPVREHLQVPLSTRLQWGAVKNLLSGATTVCHHNPFHRRIFTQEFPVRVPRRYGWAHSLEFSPDLADRFKRTPADWPFVVHVAEAVDRVGKEEVMKLDRIGALTDRTVLIHAVALDERGVKIALARGASLVWCPSSNVFILGRTLGRKTLESGIRIALGTDSALTGRGGLLEEIHFARDTGLVPVARLYEMVTSEAAQVMRFNSGEGNLAEGGVADFLVVEDRGRTPASTLAELDLSSERLLFVRGEVKLASIQAMNRLSTPGRLRLHPLCLSHKRTGIKVFVAAEFPKLFADVQPILGSVILAHTKVLRAA